MSTSSSIPSKSIGRLLFCLGLVVAVAGIVVYAVCMMALHMLHTPWYVPVLGTVGAGIVLVALVKRRTVSRGIALILLVALTALEWWFVGFYTIQPSYAGPIAIGQSFPEFAAERGDGAAFTRAELASGKTTVLVFFRGHW